MTDDPLELIAKRRQEIRDELSQMQERTKLLHAELPELDAAERVLKRLSAGGPKIMSETLKTTETLVGLSKPAGTPTIPEMIFESLEMARGRGLKGLEPKGMAEYIAGKWWPDVPGVAISPIAWRMWKRGDLAKDDSIYMLKKPEAADLLTKAESAASKTNP